MIKFLTLFTIICLAACQQAKKIETENKRAENEYDSTEAQKLGADDYGMKTYVMAFLKSGGQKAKDSAHAAELMQSHLANINRMAEKGQLVLAGPFYGNDSLRGIYVFNTENLDSARKWTSADPSIQYGTLKMELRKWYGSAALMKVNEIHRQIAKKSI